MGNLYSMTKSQAVILTTPAERDAWMTAPPDEALAPQRPPADDVLPIVARGKKKDEMAA